MSVAVSIASADGDAPAIVSIGDAVTCGALVDAIHATLALPHPPAAYDICVEGGGAEAIDAEDLRDKPLEDLGIYGCEERVLVRARYAYVARAQLKEEGISTPDAADAALWAAVDAGDVERVKFIAAAGVARLLLHLCRAMRDGGQEEVVEALLLADALDSADEDLLDFLMIEACSNSPSHIVSLFLQHSALTDAEDEVGATALHVACMRTDGVWRAVVDVLLDHGADATAVDDGGATPLHRVCERRWDEDGSVDDVVKLLIEHGADAGARESMHGGSVLHCACARGDTAAARVLVAHGADVNARMFAPLCEQFLLTDHVASNPGDMPLHSACAAPEANGASARATALYLLENGAAAHVNARGSDGGTPLRRACEYNNRALAILLLQHGADAHANSKVVVVPQQWVYSDEYLLARVLGGPEAAAVDANGQPLQLGNPDVPPGTDGGAGGGRAWGLCGVM